MKESISYLQQCSKQLSLLKNNPDDQNVIEELFRSFHSLKGMSAAMSYDEMTKTAHSAEDILELIRSEKVLVTKEVIKKLTQSAGHLEHLVAAMANEKRKLISGQKIEAESNLFSQLIRQLSINADKKITVQITGLETELDAIHLELISEPLIHLIKNAVDHGIEKPENRIKRGKSEKGKIELRAYRTNQHVFVEIKDDGAGINKKKVVNNAISLGILSGKQLKTVDEQFIFNLTMKPGVSTANEISAISGRGVGLDAVKTKIESFGGSISIQSEAGKGTVISIKLPIMISQQKLKNT
ncbi:chemotaxis protein CheA [Jeotgalibacillus proteolyticus]|nr:ATP-binding protein [Jeotgalibacillus proteolyticus]